VRWIQRRRAFVLLGRARRPAVVFLRTAEAKARLDVVRVRLQNGLEGFARLVVALVLARDVGHAQPGFDQFRVELQSFAVELLCSRKCFGPAELPPTDFGLHDP
jgi:hypothetical protein